MKKLIQTLCVVISLNAVAFAADMQKLVDRINAAHAVLHELWTPRIRVFPMISLPRQHA